jgi:hypothetical protein
MKNAIFIGKAKDKAALDALFVEDLDNEEHNFPFGELFSLDFIEQLTWRSYPPLPRN